MADLHDLLAQQTAHYQARPAYSPRCADCKDAKRTHRRGYYNCKKKGCTCAQFVYDHAAQATWNRDVYQPWLTRYRELNDEVTAARNHETPEQRAARERTHQEALAAQQREADRRAAEQRAARAVDVRHFASFSAFAKACQEAPIHPANRARWQATIDGNLAGNSRSFALGDDGGEPGCPTRPADLAAWLLKGWPKGVAAMREGLGRIELPRLSDVRRRGRWSDTGDTLSLDRLYGGNVDRCWRTTHRQRCGTPPRLQIVVEATMSAATDAQDAFWRGAAATALADAATAAGYAVAVDVLQSIERYTNGGADLLTLTRAKDYDTPTNPAVTAALTAHASILRVFTFALQDSIASDTVNGGRGHAMRCTERDLELRGLCDPKSLLLLVPQDTYSARAAKAWVRETAARLERIATGEGEAA